MTANSMTGAQMVVQALVDQGVDTVFGYPGGAVLPIYDELFQQSKIKHILVRHEQGATHAAEGYARSTGKPGVVLVTSGPGATNAVTGITDALMDSIPLVVLTGQVPTFMIGSDAFQEADTVGITRPCTKMNWLVKETDALASTKRFISQPTDGPGQCSSIFQKTFNSQRARIHPPRRQTLGIMRRRKKAILKQSQRWSRRWKQPNGPCFIQGVG